MIEHVHIIKVNALTRGMDSAAAAPTSTNVPPGRMREMYAARGMSGSPEVSASTTWYTRLTGGSYDEVKSPFVSLECLGRVASTDEDILRSHFLCIFNLRGSMRNGSNIGSHCRSKENTKVTQTSHSDYSDILGGGSCSVLAQGGEDGHTSTHHRGGIGGIKSFRDGYGEVGWTSPVVGVSTECLVTLSALSNKQTTISACTALDAVLLPA